MRRRLNRAIDELNTRLKLRIQPFKLAKRQSLIDQLVFDPEVLGEIEQYAKANGVPREVAQALARRYAREIVPSFSAYAYFGVGARLARWISTVFYRVRLGYMDEDALKTVDPDSAVIFVINHRSNMDYVLVTYMASTSSALSYAVGEWARVWLLQSLIRSMGAYFVRRDSRDPLYRKVLARYVHMAVAGRPGAGDVPGGRADPRRPAAAAQARADRLHGGGLRCQWAARRGVRAGRHQLRPRAGRPRAARARSRPRQAAAAPPLQSWRLSGLSVRHVALRLRGRWHRFGYACVSFGPPLSLRQYVKERGIDFRVLDQAARFAEVERLAKVLMEKVGERRAGAAGGAGGDRAARCRRAALRCWNSRRACSRWCSGSPPRRACPYSARRSGLCHRGGPAHAEAAPSGRGARRPLPRRAGGGAAAALLRQLDRASAVRWPPAVAAA